MGTVQPNIFKFVTGLLNEQEETEHILSRIEAGHEPAARRPAYVANDQRLINIVQKFNREVFDDSYIPFLKSVAHNLSIWSMWLKVIWFDFIVFYRLISLIWSILKILLQKSLFSDKTPKISMKFSKIFW